ncbi:related to phenazine biosynthesis-like protein [Cephalotrichum gorgonifer]|uniref:Related to phenazine biosynthesis-like protein n=1 Tax=Cephalotrichum gorgonifer TaxID=2041049 RepID=A0AAE8MTG3_9PEZI|nr:related to phenazine biosynthesis-like protein [Cephalotrichum gorgonifer]
MARYLDFATTDVFTSSPFAGNPLAIVFLPSAPDSTPLTQAQKQLIAREFNLSETIFVHPASESSERTVDIFTTDEELPFAGHPTIGSAAWLLSSAAASGGAVAAPEALRTKSGRIPISVVAPRFAAQAVSVGAAIAHDTRLHAARFPAAELLRLQPALAPYVAPSAEFPVFSIVKGMSQVHVELPSLEALAAVATTTGSVSCEYLDEGWGSSHIVTYFFVRGVRDEVLGREVIRTRMIEGALEDPATGSAASGLASYLTLTGGAEGVHKYDVVQGVEMGRRSEIGVDVGLSGDGKIKSVDLVGSAVEISSGRIRIPE